MPTPAQNTVSVTMPDGTVVRDVPADITQEELWERYMASQTPKTSIDKALAQQERDTALVQAKAQQDYDQRQAAWAKLELENPAARYANPLVVDEPPVVQPYLEYREKHLPPSPVQKLGATFKTKLLEDQETQRRVVARTLFPNDPNGIDRVGIHNGEMVYVDDEGNLQQLSSGATRFLAGLGANSPEMIGAALGSYGGISGSAGGASLAHGIKRTIAGQIFGEPFDPVGIGKGMATEAALSAVGDVPGRLIGHVGNRGTFVNMTKDELDAARAVRDRIKDTTGIDADIAQASGNRKLIAMRNMLSRFPGQASDTMQKQDERSLAQFHNRSDEVLDMIAKGITDEAAGEQAANAASLAIQSARRKAQNAVGNLYDAAYAKNPSITDPELLSFLQLPYFPEAYKRGQRIAALERKQASTSTQQVIKETRKKHPSGAFSVTEREVTEVPITQPDLRSLDYLKRGLNSVIEELQKNGDDTTAGALKQRAREFTAQLDKLPSGEYQAARKLYAQKYAELVKPLERGPVGVLSKLKDKNAVRAGAQVFGDASVTKSQIETAKAAITAEDPEAWNNLVRTWLADTFNTARTEVQHGVEVNPAGKARKLVYGNPKLRAKMDVILPASAKQAFDDLMFAAQRLSLTNVAGSNTMRDTEMANILKGRALATWKWLMTPKKKLIDSAEEEALERGSLAMAEAITDPTKVRHIRRVLRMKPSTQQAILLSTIIGSRTGAEALRAAYPNLEDTPEFAQAE